MNLKTFISKSAKELKTLVGNFNKKDIVYTTERLFYKDAKLFSKDYNSIIKNVLIAQDNAFNLFMEDQKQVVQQIKVKREEAIVKRKETKKNKKTNKMYTAHVLYFNRLGKVGEVKPDKKYGYFKHNGYLYVQIYKNHLNIPDSGILNYNGQKVFDFEKVRWEKIWTLFMKDKENVPSMAGSSSEINCVHVTSVNEPVIGSMFAPKYGLIYAEDEHRGIYHKNINYSINHEAKTFGEMFNIEYNEYVQDNYKHNSCFINVLVNTYYEQFQKYKKGFQGEYDDFCELFGMDLKNDSLGLCIDKSLDFFKQFNLGLCVIGQYGIIEKYKPEKVNKHIYPSTLYLLVSNNHCYQLNTDLKQFQQVIWNANETLDEELKVVDNVTNLYQILKTDNHSYNTIYVDNLNEIMNHIKNCDQSVESSLTFIVRDGNINNLMFEMVNGTPSYIPNVNIQSGKITNLMFRIENITAHITVCSTIDTEQKDLIIGEKIYKNYHLARNNLYSKLFTTEHLSFYNPNNMEIEKKFPMRPQTGFFKYETPCNELCIGVDTRKAYTADFMDIKFYPVYEYFDMWKIYDNKPIEDYSQYIVKCKSEKPEILILFPELYSRVTGYKLNRIDFKDYEIVAFKKPIKLESANSKDLIDELWNTKISDDQKEDTQSKKDIFNIISGLLEKKYNKKSVSKIFKSYDEAFYYQSKYGGEIYTMAEETDMIKAEKDKSKVYVLVKKSKAELINGFTPIKEMIYDIRSLKNYQTFMKLKTNGITPLAIKTDSILVDAKHTEAVKELFDFSDVIGKFKLEFDKEISGNVIEKFQKQEAPIINGTQIVTHTLKNERDSVEFNELIDKTRSLLLLGALAGVGKTTTACSVNGKKLFVCPYNKLCQSLQKKGMTAVTLNILLGIGCNNEINNRMKQLDVSEYDCVVFDEIFLYDIKNLKKIHDFMLNNKEKKFIATGDVCQNDPIGIEEFTSEYREDCVNFMFSDQLVLKECKRLKNKSDIERMTGLKADILNTRLDVMTTIKKYNLKVIRSMKDLKSKNNVCYFNFRCENVNKHVQKTLIQIPKKSICRNGNNYYEGLNIICREHYKGKTFKLFVNYEYTIVNINEKTMKIKEPVSGEEIVLETYLLNKFKLPYALTNHSVQGLTIEDEYTIFDANAPHVDRKWLWVALSRTDNLNKITVYEHSVAELNGLTVAKRKQYINMKVENYKRQDEKAGRIYVDDEYVTGQWIQDQHELQKGVCKLCKIGFEIVIENGKVRSNITVDRKKNSLPHHKDNCFLSCIKCNCSRK